jgi:hypothetical protein
MGSREQIQIRRRARQRQEHSIPEISCGHETPTCGNPPKRMADRRRHSDQNAKC